jgi:ubiquinone/menaquinone biosynthesis C-methylase UbiE
MQTLVTHQQEMYEVAYSGSGAAVAIPDLKITDGTSNADQRILTLGGGIANDVWHLANKNFVVNADYAVAGLRAGLQNGVKGVAVNLNSCALLPFQDHTFDIVVCNDILEHLLEPLSILKEAVRVLRKDGRIIVNVPNHNYWPMRLRFLLGKGIMWRGLITDHAAYNHEWDYMHIRFFTDKGFRQFLDIAGLNPEKFYWDFGNLAHYYNPDRWIQPQLVKQATGQPLSRRAKLGIYIIRPFWRAFNAVVPLRVRSWIVSLCPGLLSAGFYVRCRKK